MSDTTLEQVAARGRQIAVRQASRTITPRRMTSGTMAARSLWWGVTALPLAASLSIAGCAYDPYSGTYVPCCAAPAYGNTGPQSLPGSTPPQYPAAYPAPQPPYADPGYASPGSASPSYASPGYASPAYGNPGYADPNAAPYGQATPQAGVYPQSYAAPTRPAAGGLMRRFEQANVTGDGRLTYAQAQQAQWHVVVRNFGAIDTSRRGYVTLADIRAWRAARRAAPNGAQFGEPG